MPSRFTELARHFFVQRTVVIQKLTTGPSSESDATNGATISHPSPRGRENYSGWGGHKQYRVFWPQWEHSLRNPEELWLPAQDQAGLHSSPRRGGTPEPPVQRSHGNAQLAFLGDGLSAGLAMLLRRIASTVQSLLSES